jgi:hypothetical protein
MSLQPKQDRVDSEQLVLDGVGENAGIGRDGGVHWRGDGSGQRQ